MTWDWSFLGSAQFWFAFGAGLVAGVAANFLTKAIERWRERRNARRNEEHTKRSARRQELFDYRLQLARQDRFRAMVMFHRGNSLRIVSEVWEALGFFMILSGMVGYFTSISLLVGVVNWRDFVPMLASVGLIFCGGFFYKRGDRRFWESRDLLDPVEDTLTESDKPLLYPDVWLDGRNYVIPAQPEKVKAE